MKERYLAMNSYTDKLGLRFDPFDSIAGTSHFYPGGGRQELLDDLLHLNGFSRDIVAVTGPLGIGKSALAERFIRQLGRQVSVAYIEATLFMSRSQVLESIAGALGESASGGKPESELLAGSRQAIVELSRKEKLFQIVIDDAHELGDEGLRMVIELAREPALAGAVRLLLLGENQLLGMLEQLLPFNREIVAFSKFALAPFNNEQMLEYIDFKLRSAGFKDELPIETGVMGNIFNQSHGVPGTVNALVRDQLELIRIIPPTSPLEIPAYYYATAAVLFVALMATVIFTGGPAEPAVVPDSNRSRVDIPLPLGNPLAMQDIPAGALGQDQQSQLQPQPLPVAAAAEPDISAPEPPAVTAAVAVTELPVNPDGESSRVPDPVPPEAPAATPVHANPLAESLLSRAPESFTLQVLGSQSEAKVREFIEQSGRTGFTYFETVHQARPWFVVVYGEYPNRDAAAAAVRTLPSQLQQLQPWARQLAGIQADIRKHNQ